MTRLSSVQWVIDGARLMYSGIKNSDPELVYAGWLKVKSVRGGMYAKRLFGALLGLIPQSE